MITQILRVLFILLEVVVLFNLLIIVHELGHFLAARWRGLFIEGFGVWFGKPLWKKTINGVQYSLGSIPFGGFVKLPQLAPMDIIEGEADVDRAKLPQISALDKIIVAIAGPLFSLLLAFAFACVVWGVGHPKAESDMTTVIGYVHPDSSAERAGLMPGDKILEVDHRPVTRFNGMTNSVNWNVVSSEGVTIPFKVQRGAEIRELEVEPFKAETRGWRRRSVRQVLIEPAETAIIEEVAANSPAATAGLRHGDVVAGVNGKPIYNPAELSDYVNTHAAEPIVLNVERDNQTLTVALTPKIVSAEEHKPRLGIQWGAGRMSVAHPSPLEQVYNSVTGTLNTMGAVASPKSDVKLQHMSGPFGIFHVYYIMLFQREGGWQLALWFSVILNVNLAMLNMLPIPVLDGGHIVLALIESARRKPVNVRLLEFVQTACAVLIIGYMAYVSFFDIGDWFGKEASAPKSKPAATQPTPAR